MSSKYREEVLCLVEREKIRSTTEILRLLEAKVKKTINWSALFRILSSLERDGRIKRMESKGGIFWIRV